MNIESLRNFVAVAEAGSITKASQGLFISAQGLNKMVSSMEDELGYRLVERTRRGVTLTDSGIVFLKHARKLLKDYDAMLGDLARGNRDHSLMMECPYKIAATALCIERVVQPLVSLGLMGDVSLREVSLDDALGVSAKEGWLAVVDLPSYVQPRPDSLTGSTLEPIAVVKMGVVYSKAAFPDLKTSPTVDEVARLPLGVIDAPTMRLYSASVFSSNELDAQMRYLTRQYDILADAAIAGKAAMLYDSLSFSQSKFRNQEDITFAQIEDHICELGFVHRSDAKEPNKKEYIDAFRRVFHQAAKTNRWDIS